MSMPQIDPSVYDEVLALGSQSAQLDPEISRQKLLADYLRTTLGRAPQSRMSGRIASAPGFVEMLGALTAQGVAANKDRSVQGMQQKQENLRYNQTARVLEALKRQQQMYRTFPGQDIEGGQ